MMRLHPMMPIYIIAPIIILALCLLVACLVKKKWRKTKNFRRIAMMLLISLVLLRPVFLGGLAEKKTNNLNIFFVVDATNSMNTRDVENRERYKKVDSDIQEIARHFIGAKYSIIIEDSIIYTALPLTTNLDALNSTSVVVKPKSETTSTGSNLSELISHAGKRVSEQKKYRKNRVNIVFFMGDGENNTGDAIRIESSFKNSVSSGAVLGYGSVDGGIIPSVEQLGKQSFSSPNSTCIGYIGNNPSVEKKTTSDNRSCVVSKINETNLKKIATGLGINYYHRESGDVPDALYDSIDEEITYTDLNEDATSYIDTYWVLGMGIVILMLWEFYEILNNILLERNSQRHAKS